MSNAFNLKGSSIPTILELPCCSFRSCHTRLTDGRCSNFILHDRGFGLNGPRQVHYAPDEAHFHYIRATMLYLQIMPHQVDRWKVFKFHTARPRFRPKRASSGAVCLVRRHQNIRIILSHFVVFSKKNN